MDEQHKKPVKVTVRLRKGNPTVRTMAETLRTQSGYEIPSDVTGSYTGTPLDGLQPEQDADDL